MLSAILIAAVLVAATVAVHASGFGLLLSSLVKTHAALPVQSWPITRLLIWLAWLLILIHVTEITVWALFYLWAGCMPDAESAFYFSGVTYTTVGYGDLVLPERWRILGPIEALTGILMCGLSAGLFFASVTRIYSSRLEIRTR
jgi:Ion channel